MGADDRQLEFLGALEALGGSAGNGKLRELLGWDEATYETVKQGLMASGQLQTGRGRGGSVSLAGSGNGHESKPRITPAAASPGPQPKIGRAHV